MLRGLCLARGTRLFTEVGRSPPLSASRHVFYACRRKLESSRSCTGRLHHDHHQGPTQPAQACQRPKLSRRDPTWHVFFRLVQGRRPTHVCWSSFLTALCLWVLWLRVPAAKEGLSAAGASDVSNVAMLQGQCPCNGGVGPAPDCEPTGRRDVLSVSGVT